jgi:uncharacterized membrane protein YdfJ with MMPL/SSD domain
LVLVPVTMELLGDRNWWVPRWLDRLLPDLNVETDPTIPFLAPAATTGSRADRDRQYAPVS